jgi:hypothetical protein
MRIISIVAAAVGLMISFEMQLVGNQNALLRIILTDEDIRSAAEVGVPAPKPIPLNKMQ